MKEKKCSKCGIILPIDNFSRASKEKSGLKSSCKKCNSDYQKNIN